MSRQPVPELPRWDGPLSHPFYSKVVKRALDFLLALVLLIPGCILMLPLAVWVKLDSPGPVFYRALRGGYHNKPFYIMKFRSMVVNAEHIGDGIYINEKSDNRITKVGRFLRSTSLDELPQLFNVFVGDMSLVGPRPPVTYHPYDGYENYPDWAKKRFEMKPGMTGLVQVKMRNESSWDERIVVDNQYVDNFSVLFDLKILLQTVMIVLKHEAY